ncbi:putative methyltransferase C9orf114 homolog [Phymastichus coffea]|uniref:putative methyltransferase C9orf114 homolog n=1 Tax=Phymastichus coffea TaxID=108790 RepID=UPI00273CC8BB|nr:putative methyltransferase C9orf114 homolog [Phymastichus coffea]
MLPTKPVGKSWKEMNREYKERRKKWREERLIKQARLKREKDQQEMSVAAEEKTNFEVRSVSTVSIAVPGSIIDNAQSSELRTYLAGQVARAACIYKVDEVIVFDDKGDFTESERKKLKNDEVFGEARPGCLQLARILQYLECPQYLRKYFFPIHKDLQYAGLLNPLDTPHHLRQQDASLFREGVVTNKLVKEGRGSLVNVGLLTDVRVDKVLTNGLRVTVKIPEKQENPNKPKGFIVPPLLPRSETGIYWGYTVRLALYFSDIFAKCPYSEGYDVTIGTSDKGTPIDDVPSKSLKYKHALIVFGGLSGIEDAIENDPNLKIDDASLVFNHYFNVCPQQGSRTIRTEEAILLTLAELRTKLDPKNPALNHPQFNHESVKSDDSVSNDHKTLKIDYSNSSE